MTANGDISEACGHTGLVEVEGLLLWFALRWRISD
jgi:hypothetical protein